MTRVCLFHQLKKLKNSLKILFLSWDTNNRHRVFAFEKLIKHIVELILKHYIVIKIYE